MRSSCCLLVGLTIVCIGCDGRQKGKFAVSGSESHSLDSQTGSLTVLRGHALTADYQPRGTDKPLIYWLIICPGLQANGSGSESSEGSYRSVHKETWFATPNDVTIELAWDRRDDAVAIHGERYNRSDGNVFVVVRESDGTVSSWQIENVDDDAKLSEVMRHIRERLPDNKVVAKAKLIEMDTN